MIEAGLPIEERINQLLQHFGIQQAHFAASTPADWKGLLNVSHEGTISLTLLDPQGFDLDALRPVESRLLVITGDQGPRFSQIHDAMTNLTDSTHICLENYFAAKWACLTCLAAWS